MPFQTGFTTTLAERAEVADTSIVVAVAPTITSGRALLRNSSGTLREWISFTGVTGTTLTGVTRGLSQTADPATSGTGLTWIAGTKISIVAMHDQIMDRQKPKPLVFATTAARDSALGANGAATEAYVNVYVTATGLHCHYNLSTAQWEELDVGTVTPNASATAAGKVEIATSAESIAGTDTGGTGAFVSVLPSDIAKNAQSGTFVYGAASDVSDTYTVSLIPTLTAYSTGQKVTVKFTTANTGACTINVDGLGAKFIKTIEGNDPQDGDIAASSIHDLTYDGTNFVLDYFRATTAEKGFAEMATDAEAIAGADEQRYVNPKQLVDIGGRGKISSTSFSGNLSNFSLGIPHATFSKISVKFMITGGSYGFENNTGILMFDNTNGKGSQVVVGRNNAADEGYGYAPRLASATTSTWTGYSYDGIQNNVCTLKKGTTYYEIDYTHSYNAGNTMYAIFDVSYSI